jgi:AcrR family transcriptional regulator
MSTTDERTQSVRVRSALAADSLACTALAATPLPGTRPGRDRARALKRGPSRVPPEVVAATQRERLLDGLVHTVAGKGYASARVSDICLAAGVTRPVFYALFEGKEDAFLAAYRQGTGVLFHMVEDAYLDAPGWRPGVRAGLAVLLDVLASVPSFATMAIVEIDAVGAAARQERDQLLRRFRRFFAAALRPAGPAGPVSSHQLADAVIGGAYSMIYRHVAWGNTAELPELLPALTYFVLAPYLGPAGAASELAAPAPERPVGTAPCASRRS